MGSFTRVGESEEWVTCFESSDGETKPAIVSADVFYVMITLVHPIMKY
jgi:hypothetical protein